MDVCVWGVGGYYTHSAEQLTTSKTPPDPVADFKLGKLSQLCAHLDAVAYVKNNLLIRNTIA
jgi:hypothetical protein